MPDYFADIVRPGTPEELVEALAWAQDRGQSIELGGNFSKRKMGGPAGRANIVISTSALNRVRQYEPHDLTLSVEAGISYCEVKRLLAEHHQMLPLDPPFSDSATIGGVVATNSSGPRRRLYGTARDMVIGMEFATLAGKLVRTGGMVVKNVAGLDMGKLMIGSFGTLAALVVINFKVIPQPPVDCSFRFGLDSPDGAIAARDALLKSPLDFAAMDLVKSERGWVLALRAGGNSAAMARYERELAQIGAQTIPAGEAEALWNGIQNFTPRYLESHEHGAVVRVSCTLKELNGVIQTAPGPVLARAGSGVCYVYFEEPREAAAFAAATARTYPETVVEFAPEESKDSMTLWPSPGQDLEIMKRIKAMFDPHHLLNRGRLYHHI